MFGRSPSLWLPSLLRSLFRRQLPQECGAIWLRRSRSDDRSSSSSKFAGFVIVQSTRGNAFHSAGASQSGAISSANWTRFHAVGSNRLQRRPKMTDGTSKSAPMPGATGPSHELLPRVIPAQPAWRKGLGGAKPVIFPPILREMAIDSALQGGKRIRRGRGSRLAPRSSAPAHTHSRGANATRQAYLTTRHGKMKKKKVRRKKTVKTWANGAGIGSRSSAIAGGQRPRSRRDRKWADS